MNLGENEEPSGLGETAAHGEQIEKMESRPARLFGCAWRANGREAVMRRTLLKGRRLFIHRKSRPFPQRPKHRVCDFTALLLIYEDRKDHVYEDRKDHV